jgi:hypothetical protein
MLYREIIAVCSQIHPKHIHTPCGKNAFGPKRDELTGEWRKLHNEGLNDLYPHQTLFR